MIRGDRGTGSLVLSAAFVLVVGCAALPSRPVEPEGAAADEVASAAPVAPPAVEPGLVVSSRQAGRSPSTAEAPPSCASDLDEGAHGVALAPDGSMIVLGSFCGETDLDPSSDRHEVSTAGGQDVFVAKLGPDRHLEWARTLGGPSDDEPLAVALGADGAVVVAAAVRGELDADPGPELAMVDAGRDGGVLLLRLSPEGSSTWSALLGGAGALHVADLAIAPDGSIAMAGAFVGTVDLDPGDGLDERTARGGQDAFVAWLEADGSHRISRTFGGYGDEAAIAVGAAPDGTLRLAGVYSSVIYLAAGARSAAADTPVGRHLSMGERDLFVVSLDGAGRPLWGGTLGGSGDDQVGDLAVLESGSLLLAGSFESLVDLDPGAGARVANAGTGTAAFLLRLDDAGAFEWARTRAATRETPSLAATPRGESLLVVGGGALGLSAEGEVRWARWVGPDAGEDDRREAEVRGVALGPGGLAALVGRRGGAAGLEWDAPGPHRGRGLLAGRAGRVPMPSSHRRTARSTWRVLSLGPRISIPARAPPTRRAAAPRTGSSRA